MNEHVEFRDVRFPLDDTPPRPERREPQFGVVSPPTPHPVRLTRPRSHIIAGFETQELRLRVGGRVLAFRRTPEGGPSPFLDPVILASTSVHSYDAESLERFLPAVEAVAISADRQWVDRLLVLPDRASALGVAAGLGGRFAMRWTELGMAVLDLASGLEVSHFAVSGRELLQRCCPLIPDARPGDRCKQHGGPWVSRSRIAASRWNDRRRLYWDLVGCDQGCPTPRQRECVSVPTRYDLWLHPEGLAQRDLADRSDRSTGDGRQRMGPGPAHPAAGVVSVTTPDGDTRTLPVAEPVVLSKGMIVEVGVDDTEVWQALGRILVDPAGGGEDPLDWSDSPLHWQTTDADLGSRAQGLPLLPRWAAIGSLRVTGLCVGSGAVPLAFDLRQAGAGLLLERTWLRVGPYRIGDVGMRPLCIIDGAQPDAQCLDSRCSAVDLTFQWVLREGLEALVALSLEPYDPDARPSPAGRRHLALRDAAIGRVEIGLDPNVLRRRLQASAQYRRVRAALRKPDSDPGFFRLLQVFVDQPDQPFRLD
ncbi:MAG: hypothetical protein R2720_06875 [Candidatus Nanopelagicales bacterium]